MNPQELIQAAQTLSTKTNCTVMEALLAQGISFLYEATHTDDGKTNAALLDEISCVLFNQLN